MGISYLNIKFTLVLITNYAAIAAAEKIYAGTVMEKNHAESGSYRGL